MDSLLEHHISLLQSISLSSSFWRFAGPRSPSEPSEPLFRFFSLFPSSCGCSRVRFSSLHLTHEKSRHPSNPAKSHFITTCLTSLQSPAPLMALMSDKVLYVFSWLSSCLPCPGGPDDRIRSAFSSKHFRSLLHLPANLPICLDCSSSWCQAPSPAMDPTRQPHVGRQVARKGKARWEWGQKPRLPLATADGLSEIFMLKWWRLLY